MQGTKLGVAALLRCQLSHCANLQLHLPQLADSSKISDADDGPAPLLPAPQVARALAPRARFNVVIVTPACTPADNVGLQAALKVDPHLSRWAVHHGCVMIFACAVPWVVRDWLGLVSFGIFFPILLLFSLGWVQQQLLRTPSDIVAAQIHSAYVGPGALSFSFFEHERFVHRNVSFWGQATLKKLPQLSWWLAV